MTDPIKAKNYIATACENWENHSQEPNDYLGWHTWAEEKSKMHIQIKCEGCGLYKIWVLSTIPKKHGQD